MRDKVLNYLSIAIIIFGIIGISFGITLIVIGFSYMVLNTIIGINSIISWIMIGFIMSIIPTTLFVTYCIKKYDEVYDKRKHD